MAIEDEVKLEAALDFVEPQIAIGEAIEEIEIIPEVRTITLYFDTPDFGLAGDKIALRFRYRLSHQGFASTESLVVPDGAQEGIWALKSKGKVISSAGVSTTAREELEVVASFREVPHTLISKYPVVGEKIPHLGVVAAMDARRRSRKLIADATAVVEIDDDLVRVLVGANAGEIFREIEFELLDAEYANLRADVVREFLGAGAQYSRSGSKLERALSH